MQLEELKIKFNETFDEAIKLVSDFKPDEINVKPSENKWSAAQIARHLIKANSGFPMMVTGEGEATERKPDAMIDKIECDFADFNIKMEAADFLVPEDRVYDQDELINSLEIIKSDINATVENKDMIKTFKEVEFPVYGYLTGLEALAFVTAHTQRHIHQLKKNKEKIGSR